MMITMENHHFELVNPLSMVIFHRYVELPEGIFFLISRWHPYKQHTQKKRRYPKLVSRLDMVDDFEFGVPHGASYL